MLTLGVATAATDLTIHNVILFESKGHDRNCSDTLVFFFCLFVCLFVFCFLFLRRGDSPLGYVNKVFRYFLFVCLPQRPYQAK